MSESSRDKAAGKAAPEGAAAGPDDSPCTCAVLRRTARRVTRLYDEALRPSGLRLTQYSVLANVERANAGEAGPPTVTELADRLEMERTTLTRNLKPLAKAGLLRIAPGPDQRSRAVEITEQGRAAVARARPLWQEAERRFRRTVGREASAELRRRLDSVVRSFS